MKHRRSRPLCLLTICLMPLTLFAKPPSAEPIVLAVHGGLPDSPGTLRPDEEKKMREALEQALLVGFTVIRKNGSAVDAVVAAVTVLEDSPYFNAGKGSVFTRDGKNELDSSIMEGNGKRAGAVAVTTIIKNPITAAKAVMEKTPHVFLAGVGADQFAKEAGLTIVPPEYFKTEREWNELQDFLKATKTERGASLSLPKPHWGTVGAVALDSKQNLAAGTSTGGLTGKRPGRIGDSPVIGAGTYADNDGVATSATGQGEYFIRLGVAHEINAQYKYKGLSLSQSADEVIQNQLTKLGGKGAVVVLNRKGEAAFSFNTEGMYRGTITKSGKTKVDIYAAK